jgi:predicted transcriptional regulator
MFHPESDKGKKLIKVVADFLHQWKNLKKTKLHYLANLQIIMG